MRSLMASVFIISVFAVFVSAADIHEELKTACAEEWPGDFRMQEYCYKRQWASAKKMFEKGWFEPTIKGDLRTIVFHCMDQWLDKKTREDYRMMEYCVDKQWAARNRLKSGR